MTGSDLKAVKTFLLLLVFLGAVMTIFFYTAQKQVLEIAQVTVPPSSKKAGAIAWERLRDLKDDARAEVRVNGARTIAEVMRSDAKRQQGLSGRAELAEGEGMLFIFDREEAQSFWNKDMKFPIDVLWLARGTVIGVSSLPLYDGQAPVIITAPSPVDVVLEVPGGFAQKHNIMVGNTIDIRTYAIDELLR